MHDRLPGAVQLLDERVLIGVGIGRQAQVDEESIAAVRARVTARLEVDRNDGGAVLARGLGHQLLEPRAERRDAGRRKDRQLVAARLGRLANHHTERDAGVGRGVLVATGVGHLGGLVEQASDVDASQRGRHRAERRQHGEPPADRRLTEGDGAEAIAFGHLLHLRSGIGDRHDVTSRLGLAHHLLEPIEEVRKEDVGLERTARLARDEHERGTQVDGVVEALHLRRVGRVQHVQTRCTWSRRR